MTMHRDADGFLKQANAWYKDPLVISAAMAPAVGAAVQAGSYGIQKLMESKQKARAYKGMLASNKHLHGKSSRKSQQYFNTLWTMNPTLAKDPLTAGAFVFRQHASQDPTFPNSEILAGAQVAAGINNDIMSARSRAPRMDFGGPASRLVSGIGDAMSARAGYRTELANLNAREDAFGQKRQSTKRQEEIAMLKRMRERMGVNDKKVRKARKAADKQRRVVQGMMGKESAGKLYDMGTALRKNTSGGQKFMAAVRAAAKKRARSVVK